jgi:hypothetical protein
VIYTHDASNILIAHNTLLDNAHDGLRELVVTERSYANRRLCEASNETISGNLFYGNKEAAISLPLDSPRSRYNHSDDNAFAPDPKFVINNNERRIPIDDILKFCQQAFDAARVPDNERPDLKNNKDLPVLSLSAWRLVMQMDQNSKPLPDKFTMHLDREKKVLQIDLPSENAIPTAPASPADDFDLLGKRDEKGRVRAGAIQDLHAGAQSITLWPLPKVEQGFGTAIAH